MNKKCVLLSILLLLVPSCGKNKSHYSTTVPTIVPVNAESNSERAEFDEELGAFIVKEDENRFSASSAAQLPQEEEELTVETSEPTGGDIHSDSAQYGLKTLFFEFNKYRIEDVRPDQRPVLEHDLRIIKSLVSKGYKIGIEGHACDSAGSTEYNMMLSEDRARSVANYLKSNGIAADLHVIGHGCAHLIVLSGTMEQQAPNRRVEIYAYPSGK
ncbi:OmpA family protein [Candidatus Dependentiae bacterium]|nr:OmpA family protein [Candidatus Dependentiae bacterium]